MTQCAFGPHTAVVAFQGEDITRPSQGRVEMTNCTALLTGESAVCRMERSASCSLAARHCLFSRPDVETAEEPAGGSVLIRQAQEKPENFRYLGEDNRYHILSAFWATPKFVDKNHADFCAAVAGRSVDDSSGSRTLSDRPSEWPWAANRPLLKLVRLDDPG